MRSRVKLGAWTFPSGNLVLPALTRRAQEYLELPGRALVLFG